jgi:hypothetical protein
MWNIFQKYNQWNSIPEIYFQKPEISKHLDLKKSWRSSWYNRQLTHSKVHVYYNDHIQLQIKCQNGTFILRYRNSASASESVVSGFIRVCFLFFQHSKIFLRHSNWHSWVSFQMSCYRQLEFSILFVFDTQEEPFWHLKVSYCCLVSLERIKMTLSLTAWKCKSPIHVSIFLTLLCFSYTLECQIPKVSVFLCRNDTWIFPVLTSQYFAFLSIISAQLNYSRLICWQSFEKCPSISSSKNNLNDMWMWSKQIISIIEKCFENNANVLGFLLQML